MNYLKYLSTVFLLQFTVAITAQTVTTPGLNTSLIAPSPEAAALGKYGVLPITLYTGMPNVSVPIAELKSNKLSVSVSLGYNYNGYRPGEEASNIGLGWSLQGGGVITRILKGKADDDPTEGLHRWSDYANLMALTQDMYFMDSVGQGFMDTEPDIYIFNFNGHSGKFVLVGSRAFLFPHQDLKIEQQPTGFKITAEDGNCYYFQDLETTYPKTNIPQYTSSWFLSKIVSADGTDEIDFAYTLFDHHPEVTNFSETYTTKNGITSGGRGCYGGNSGCDAWNVNGNLGVHMDSKILSSIIGKNGSIKFIPENFPRKDVNGVNGASEYALGEIDVYGKPDSTLLKRIQLRHSYFGDSASVTSSLASQLKLSSIDIQGFYNNRTLGAVAGQDSLTLSNYYTFQYNNEGGAFPKGTKGIDKWGYYNGKNNNPTLFDDSFLGRPSKYPGTDRSVDPTASISGLISRITYPTGGYTDFEFEENLVNAGGPHTQNVQPRQTFDSVAYNSSSTDPTSSWQSFQINQEQTVNITFSRDISAYPNGVYNSTQILNIYADNTDSLNDPVAPTSNFPGTLVYPSPTLGKGESSRTDTVHLMPGRYSYQITCESTSASVSAVINYMWLLPIPAYSGDPGPGFRVKSIKSYDNIHSSPSLTKTYSYQMANLISSTAGYGSYTVTHKNEWGTYSELIYSSEYSSPIFSLVGDQFYYPSVTEVNHDSTGAGIIVYEYGGDPIDALSISLIKQTDYSFKDTGYIKLKEKTIGYDFKPVIDLWGITTHVSAVTDAPSCGCNTLISPLESPDDLDIMSRQVLYSADGYALSSEYSIIDSTKEISYDQNGGNPMTVVTKYGYGNNDHTLPTRSVTNNSRGDSIITLTKYPLDYSLVTCGSLYSVDTTFISARETAYRNYQAAAFTRANFLRTYKTSTPNSENTALINATYAYTPNCEGVYNNDYTTAKNALFNGSSNFYSCRVGNTSLTDAQGAIVLLQALHIVNAPIEQIVSIKKTGTEYLFSANKTDYTIDFIGNVSPKILYQTANLQNTLQTDFISNPSNYYQPRVSFYYDFYNNLIEQSKTNDLKMSYVWDYNNMYPIAQVTGSAQSNIAYTSFESNSDGNWSIPSGGRITGSITGSKSYNLGNGSISKSGLDNSQTYIISYWVQSGSSVSVSGGSTPVAKTSKSGWTCYETRISGTTSVSISGSGNIDELRLYPAGAQMTTYTYDPMIGLTSTCSSNDMLSYFEYDPLGRLKNVRNADQNIVKSFDYKYHEQQ